MHLQCHGFGPPCCTSQDATFEEPDRKDFSGDLHHTEPYGLQMEQSVSPGTREEKAVHEHFPISVTYKSLDLAISKNYPGHVVFYSTVLTLHQEIAKITYQFHDFFFFTG